MATRFFSPLELTPTTTLGTWVKSVAASIPQLEKVAQDQTPVITYTFPRHLFTSGWGNQTLVAISLQYEVATAALDAAITTVVNRQRMALDTRIVANATLADTTAFTGTNTVPVPWQVGQSS